MHYIFGGETRRLHPPFDHDMSALRIEGDHNALAADRLRALARRLELEEIVINTWTFDPAARRRSYELLARALGLTGAVR